MKQILFLFIVALIAGVVYFITKKSASKIIPTFLLFGIGFFIAMVVPLSVSTIAMVDKVILNIAPAMFFLYGIDLDLKKLLKNAIGCSCKMGAKRYWLFVVMSFVISFITQLIAYNIEQLPIVVSSCVLSGIIGFFVGRTKIKEINGSEDIATSMLYLLAIFVGMKLSLVI